MKKEKSPFARRLKMLRTEKEISQEDVGVEANFHIDSASPRINQYELGKHDPDFHVAKKIANVFGVDTSYFFTENDELADIIRKWSQKNLPQNEL